VNHASRRYESISTDFYNARGRAEQAMKEGKVALNWTRLSCHDFDANQVRLQLFVLAYNLGNFLRRLALPVSVKDWTRTTLLVKLIKTGAKVVRHARYVIFQLAEVAAMQKVFAAILARIRKCAAKTRAGPMATGTRPMHKGLALLEQEAMHNRSAHHRQQSLSRRRIGQDVGASHRWVVRSGRRRRHDWSCGWAAIGYYGLQWRGRPLSRGHLGNVGLHQPIYMDRSS